MGLFSYLREIYQLDTLDTRFTNSTNTAYQTTIDARSDPAIPEKRDGPPPGVPVKLDINGLPLAQPSRWRTPEFYVYYFVFLTIVPYMFWIVYDVSRASDPNYHKYEHLLSPGWIPGHKIDVSDAQYATFRENIPYMVLLLTCHPVLRRIYNHFRPATTKNGGNTYVSIAEGEALMKQRVSFDSIFIAIFLVILHGFSAFKILLILYTNFAIAKQLPRRYIPAATWFFNISTLFANELADGYKFEKIAAFLSPLPDPTNLEKVSSLHNWGTWLDAHGGIMSRWEILFNISVLRLISFNLDYYWSLDTASNPIEKKQLDPSNLSERDRISIPAPAKDFNFQVYLCYILYAPLYLAGPIMTFNDFISQQKYPPKTIETRRTIKYFIRFLLVLLAMEVILHFDYCVAISKGNPDWNDYTPAQLSLLSYFNLHILWLKLLLPFRFFRLWALLDGIDPPENMLRCLSDNPSTIQFWRGWHRSYNRWLTRYLYIPLGGNRPQGRYPILRITFNYGLVFMFVALWHDIKLNLLIWGWLIVLFMLPELIAGYLFPRRRWINHLTAYRVICGIGAVANLLMMMMANLVGFAVGLDGLHAIIRGIFRDWWGVSFLCSAWVVLFVGIQVQFETRETEMRKGIFLKC